MILAAFALAAYSWTVCVLLKNGLGSAARLWRWKRVALS
jgi:hypothetical protein